MSKRKRRVFTKEQKAEAVRLVRTSGESLSQVARNLDLGENSLRNWVKQADIDEGKGPDGALTTAEKAEMRRLKRELKRVTMERDFLKKPRPTSPRRQRIRSNPGGAGQLSSLDDVRNVGCFPSGFLRLAASSC